MKTAIITGVSSGVGNATAKLFQQQGYQVFGLARTASKHSELSDLGVKLFDVDLTDSTALEKTINQIKQQTSTIDVLANIAGMATNGVIETVPIEDAKFEFNVNLFGVMQLTNAVLPIMREQKHGRIINVSSVVTQVPMPLMGWYRASKSALDAVADSMRTELEPFNIQVSNLHPNGIDTPMIKTTNSFVKYSENTVYKPLVHKMAKMMDAGADPKNLSSPEELAATILKAATTEHSKYYYTLGKGSRSLTFLNRILSKRLLTKITTIPLKNSK